MDYLHILLGIALIHFFAISSPGPTLFVVAGHANADDPRCGPSAVLGVVAATFVWSSFAAAGLGTLINAVPWLPMAIRIAGGAYLAWFGFRMLRSVWRSRGRMNLKEDAVPQVTPMAALRAGFVTNISNPKVIAYYASLFGVMIPPGSTAGLFAGAVATAVLVSTLWWGAVSIFFRLPMVRRGFIRIRPVFDGVVGLALIAFGLRLVMSR
ncbi:LysE family transporter [uncultured Nitratireductor sp.]|uniref:LysE family translocator n=1 Tax=uncultured Nitratireductor sp. TaxID=520953 RepID=UPI0025E38005|nr:LysE family transporter [uncultured Nitratireductor sp.]